MYLGLRFINVCNAIANVIYIDDTPQLYQVTKYQLSKSK